MIPLLAKAEYPDTPLEVQIQVGWWALLCLVLLLFWAWTRSESLRRSILAREDPRLFAVFRIGLGLITIQNFWNLNMHWRMLWTDEGMFTGAEVRKRWGRAALSGWTEVDGFLDPWALVKFFWGKYSLLFIESSPDFVQIYLGVLIVALVLFTIGFRTRVTAVLCMLLVNSIYNRNAVYLEGHDTVFRCMWFMTIFARTDEAWSVDNWLRRARETRLAATLRAVKMPAAVPYDWLHLADRAGHWLWGGLWAWLFCVVVKFSPQTLFMVVLAGLSLCAIIGIVERHDRRAAAKAGTLEPRDPIRYRLIPAWPRYLFIAQLICLYTATGLYKTGDVWARGDALYYALNMDHFYRFEVVTQWVSVFLATNVFKLMSLVTWWWEKLFVLVALGLILRFRHMHRDARWYKEIQDVWWRRWLGRAALLGTYLTVYRIVTLAYPFCLAKQKGGQLTPAEPGLSAINLGFWVIIPLIVGAWFLLGLRPLRVGKLLARVFGGRFADAVIDQEFVRKWALGRRTWLGIGILFHGMLLTTMNIGMFPVIMMWFYPLFFEARPFLIAGRWLRPKLGGWRLEALILGFIALTGILAMVALPSWPVRAGITVVTAATLAFVRWIRPRLQTEFELAFSEDETVLETAEASLRRDPAGPWWLNPWRLFGFDRLGPVTGMALLIALPVAVLVVLVKVWTGRIVIVAVMLAIVALLRWLWPRVRPWLEIPGHERGGRIPELVVLGIGAVGVALACARGLEARTDDAARSGKAEFIGNVRSLSGSQKQAEARARKERIERLGDYGHWWVYAGLAIAGISHLRRRPAMDRPPDEAKPDADEPAGESPDAADDTPDDTPDEAGAPTPADTSAEASKPEAKLAEVLPVAEPQPIGGTLMRTIVLGFMFYHCGAIGTTFIPRYDVSKAWRTETVKVFGDYVRGINVTQSWKMFAPNPPRSNTFMRTIVIDTDDNPYQVGKDHYHERPYVFWYNDRERKMHRRMIGKSKWYLRYWSQYHCRDWARINDGHMPKEVRVFKLRTRIPKPEIAAQTRRPFMPRELPLETEHLETHECTPDMITPEMKQRWGWELSEDDLALLEKEAVQRERGAEVTRQQWADRKDFGGGSGDGQEEDE